jgi:hypothetical protein
MDGVDLLEVMKSFVNLLYPFQPLQGCLAYIVSLHVEYHSG